MAFDAVIGGQLGQGFLAHIAAFVEVDPIGQTQLKGVGVLVDFVGRHRQALAQAPVFLLLGAEGRQLRQGRRQGLAGGQQGQVGSQEPALIGGRQRCPAACRRRLGIAFNADAFDQQPSGQGTQAHGISRKKHPIEGAAHRLAIADPDHQSGPLAIDQHLGQGPQPRRGGDAAGGKPLAALGQLQGLAGLAMQKTQHIGPVEAQQADRPIAAPGLGLERTRRNGGIPGEEEGGHGVGGGRWGVRRLGWKRRQRCWRGRPPH